MGSAAFFAPETCTSPCSALAALHDDLVHGACPQPCGPSGRGLCPEREAIPPLQVLLHARVARTPRPAAAPGRPPPGCRQSPLQAVRQAAASAGPPRRRGGPGPARPRPPSSASCGSRRTSADRVGISALAMYGGLETTTSKRASGGTGAKRSPWRTVTRPPTPSASAFSFASAQASGERSTASTEAWGRSAAMLMAMQPEPVHTSSTRQGASLGSAPQRGLHQQLRLRPRDQHPRVDLEGGGCRTRGGRSGTAWARPRCAVR